MDQENFFENCSNETEVKTVYRALYSVYSKDSETMQKINAQLHAKLLKFKQ